ncbi:hypothetical protein NDU88_007527 [Pleurodeles waltl]|uniref:Uncharacterized protein n=1 Tax=Pleurodeles waltl TaxID=8319 RepID=A0AAV7U001_PLEWA|nr:hypothetical protein NDU88_007527 [Pleurodeles waltl]
MQATGKRGVLDPTDAPTRDRGAHLTRLRWGQCLPRYVTSPGRAADAAEVPGLGLALFLKATSRGRRLILTRMKWFGWDYPVALGF